MLRLRGECPIFLALFLTHSARAVEYTDRISAEGKTPSNKCPRYDSK